MRQKKYQQHLSLQANIDLNLDTRIISNDSQEQQNSDQRISFPYFNQLLDQIKFILGPQEFLQFISGYVKAPENTQKIKEEMRRLEREVLKIEAKEEEKVTQQGLQLPKDNFESKHFEYSSLNQDLNQEFKDAKWVVLTTPIIQKISGKSPNLQNRDLFLSNTQTQNVNLQLCQTNSNNTSSKQYSDIRYGQNESITNLGSITSQWKTLNAPPQKRYGHSACLVKNKLYIFSGLASEVKGGHIQTSYECQLKFNTDTGLLFQWDKIKSEGPCARDSYSCVHVGDSLIMFGGGGANSLNDLHRFDIKQGKWTQLEPVGDIPEPRDGHTAKLVGKDRMMIHGGMGQNEILFDDTYILTGISQFMDNQQECLIAQDPKLPTPNQFSFENLLQIGSYETNNNLPETSPFKSNFNSNNDNNAKLKWYKCIQKGQIPSGRDSHSSAQINNKIYIFGGQGNGDVIFDDLHSVEIIEEIDSRGDLQFVAQWEQIQPQTQQEDPHRGNRPISRTSHTCTVYKNRYLVVIGGETAPPSEPEIIENKNKLNVKNNNPDIIIDIDQDESVSGYDNSHKYFDQPEQTLQREKVKKNFLNDIWIYDTLLQVWHEIKPSFKIQGPLAGKKIKKQFEPRMAHSAVQFNQFVIVFGGLNQENQLISNDLFVLSLDGNLGSIAKAIEKTNDNANSLQVPEVHVLQKSKSNPKSIAKVAKTLKITDSSDRKEMTGQILNQIINFNSNQTNQFFLNGNQFMSSSGQNFSAQNNNDSLQRQVIKNDCEIQTIFEEPTEAFNNQTYQKEQIQLALKQNEFKMKTFQRTKVSFVKSITQQIEWPMQCFAAFIDNSIQAFEQAKINLEKQKQQQNSSLQFSNIYQGNNYKTLSMIIEINMHKNMLFEKSNTSPKSYIEVKDNGSGIHPKQLMEVLTSFGSSNILNFKSDFNFSEHGLNMKLAALRLSQTSLIITKTKPVIEYGSATSYLSIGLLSNKFLQESGSKFLIAPLVVYELRNKKILKNLTPQPDHFLNQIANYTKPIFNNGEQIQQYAMNMMNEHGTTIVMIDLMEQNVNKNGKGTSELLEANNDIVLNPKAFSVFDNDESRDNLLECSLRKYLKFLYIDYPQNLSIFINGQEVDLVNPYSNMKNNHQNAFFGEKTEKFAIQLLDEHQLLSEYMQIKNEEGQTQQANKQAKDLQLQDLISLQGILIYRGGRLIRRLECVFGHDEHCHYSDLIRSVNLYGLNRTIFKKNGIVSVYKSRSSTQIDKKDLSEKFIIRKIKEWLRNQEQTIQQPQIQQQL